MHGATPGDETSDEETSGEQSEMLSTFISNMSHEIRTPLTGIIGFAEVLGETTSEENQYYASHIESNGRRLLETLESILDLARMESEQVLHHEEVVDVAGVARDAGSLFEMQTARKGLGLTLDIPTDPVWARSTPEACSASGTTCLATR